MSLFVMVTFFLTVSPCQLLAGQRLTIDVSADHLEQVLELALDIMLDEKLYKSLNDYFITKAKSMNQPLKTGFVLSESKLVYVLTQMGEHSDQLKALLMPVSSFQSHSRDQSVGDLLEKIIPAEEITKVIAEESYTQPLTVNEVQRKSKEKSGFRKMELFVNHPYYSDPLVKSSPLIEGDDHKKIMIDFVSDARKGESIYFNFYDFDITELAEALIQAQARGVKIIGGIDLKVYNTKPASKKAIDLMLEAGLQIEKVNSVGLNHQKILVLRSPQRVSKTLFSSGNATQSCSAKEGDLKEVPVDLRPKEAVPNFNNMVLMVGDIPAVIALSEIKKNVVKKLRGQSEFPISGAYQLFSESFMDENNRKDRDVVLMAFSPNGGHGNIGNDIFSKLFQSGTDQYAGAFFSFSSKSNLEELFSSLFKVVKERKEKGLNAMNLFNLIGDNQFATREFSNLLALSGYKVIEFDPEDPFKKHNSNSSADPQIVVDNPKLVKVYVEDNSNSKLNQIKALLTPEEWDNWRSGIRVTDRRQIQGKVNYNGQDYPWQVKLHHKVLLLFQMFISTVGSSMNYSEAGEANQEQILIVYSKKVSKKIYGAIRYLFDQLSGPENSVHKEVYRRNSYIKEELKQLAVEVDRFRETEIRRSQCAKRYSNSFGKKASGW
ncbi:MAG: hypothetical protein HUU56_06590 [Bdellovibrionaceae bacterium]|nr:hypothetical protein [Pseudobdellovibrionaceae bacterium]